MTMIVTVDGPSGTGKSTVSRAVAGATGLPHLDTGAFYRAATLAVLEAGANPDDAHGVESVASRLELDQVDGITLMDGRDVSARIRDQDVSQAVSAVSAHPGVRALLVTLQRGWVESHGGRAVVEGRDIGSVVFPDADLKIYLDARPEVRAMRRALERGEDPSEVAREIERRDRLDSTRDTSPLTVPHGAVVVDTSEMTFEEVVDRVAGLVTARS
ncbi:MAG: (d)CMP kinase [Acidimicrobiia bacterium]